MPATGREKFGAGVLVGAAVLFVGFAVPRAAVVGFLGAMTLPLVLLAADVVIAAAVVTWWYPLRPAAQGLAVFGILVHALVMLRSGPVWTRGCSGVLLLTHSWALVQLFLMTAAEDDGPDDGPDDGAEGERQMLGPDRPGAPPEFVEIPVTQVVDVAVLENPGVPHGHPDAPSDPGAPDEPEHEHEGRIR
ncbi:MAG TPA: hypothetical protein VL595_25185 [Pseudonocardia sp.]|nr:hypothetical protein [Pseudonocardia sp.]